MREGSNMAITNYEFYKNNFYGDSIDESSFPKWEVRAEGKLEQILCGDLNNTDFNTEIQMAICQTADLLFAFDLREKNPNDASVSSVKSMSSGGQSISFNSNVSAIDNAWGDIAKQDRLILDKVTPYLYKTGLLYKGVM